MKQLLRGSVPVLVIGATPGGIAVASELIRANVPVTLIGEGYPLGGRGALTFDGNHAWPLWPPAYDGIPPAQWNSLSKMLSKSHAAGVCIQPEERMREILVKGNRVIEVTTEGMLGQVKRRPRLVVLASRADHFLELCSGTEHGETTNERTPLEYLDGVALHMSWNQSPKLRQRPDILGDGWAARDCSFSKDGATRQRWSLSKLKRKDEIIDSVALSEMFLRVFFDDEPSELNLAEWKLETRVIPSVAPSGTLATCARPQLEAIASLTNVASVGPLATLVPATMTEELQEGHALVNGWVKIHNSEPF